MGFPICAIDNKGEGVVYKEKNTGGCMTVNSVRRNTKLCICLKRGF